MSEVFTAFQIQKRVEWLREKGPADSWFGHAAAIIEDSQAEIKALSSRLDGVCAQRDAAWAERSELSSRLGEVRNDLWGMFAHYAPTVLSRHPDDGWLIAFCQAIEAYIPTIDRAVEKQSPK